MDFTQALGPLGIPPECIKCEQYLPPDWAESICNECKINESAAEAMKQYEDEQNKIVEEQANHRLSNNKWAKENDRKNMNKLRYEIKAAEAKLALENRLRKNPRVLQSTIGAAPTPENRSFDFQRSSGTPGSVAPSRDRSGPLSPMPAGVYRIISNSVAPGHVAPHSARRRMTREESVGPSNKISRTGRTRQVGFLTEDQIPRHPVSSMGSPPPNIPQDTGNKHKTNRPAYADSEGDGDLLETPSRSIKRSTGSREKAGVPQRQDRHHSVAASYHNISNRSSDHRTQTTQRRNSSNEEATSHQSRTPTDQRHLQDDADITGLSLDDEYPAATTGSAPRLQFNRVGRLVDSEDEYVLYSSHAGLLLTLQQSILPSFLQPLTSRRSTTEPEMARNLRPRNKCRASQSMTLVTKRTGDSASARAPKSKRQKVPEQPEPVPRQAGRLHFNTSSASAFDHVDEASAPYISAPIPKKAWAMPKDVVAKAKFGIYRSGVDRSSTHSPLADAPDAVPSDDSALLDGNESDVHSDGPMSQVTVPLTEKMSMWNVKRAINDRALASQVDKQMKTMPSFVMSDPSVSDAEESRMVTEGEIGLVKNKPVHKKVKIIQIAVVIPSYVRGVSVAKLSAASDDEDSDDDDDRVGDVRSDGEYAQVEALTILRELPQKLNDGALEPSTPPRQDVSRISQQRGQQSVNNSFEYLS